MSGSGRGLARRLVAAVTAALIAAAMALAVTRETADAAPLPSHSGQAGAPDRSATSSAPASSTLPEARMAASMAPSRGGPTSIVRITGRLTDAHGTPVDGASIAIQGSFDDVPRAFSATDRNGAFAAAIQVPPGTVAGAFTIRASLIGDTRFRPVSQTWRYTVVGPTRSPAPPAQGPAGSPAAISPGPGSADRSSPQAGTTEPASSAPGSADQQQDPANQPGPPQLPGSASPLTAGGRQNPPKPPGLIAALGGRTAVVAFVIVLGSLLALALIGWIIRGIARWIRRRRDGTPSGTGPGDGANDLFD